jgi:hypothetical protein
MVNNYFMVIKDGDVFGVVSVTEGSENEQAIVNYFLDQDGKFVLIPITEEEYEQYDEGDEIILSHT